jgi:copper chaperone CopZ
VRFVVPLRAQLRYDPTVAKINRIVDALKERGYEVALDRVEFRIPFKPLMPPQAWKVKMATLSEKVEGIASASVDFVSSRIVVDYLPNLVSPKEIQEAVVNWGSHPSSLREEVNKHEPSKIYGGGAEPGRVRGDNLHPVHSLGPGLSRSCHDEAVGSDVAGVQGD